LRRLVSDLRANTATLSGSAIFAAPGLYGLARPVAATKVENSASRALSAFSYQPSAYEKTSSRNAEKLQTKNLSADYHVDSRRLLMINACRQWGKPCIAVTHK